MGRLDHLDGIRAVAILWVAVFHYAVFWTPAGGGLPLLPYGDALAWIPLADVGALGVMMFFVVSGAVISITIERKPSARAFARARAVRLWPAMLICGTITFALTTLLGPEPLRRSVVEWLVSMTFLPPAHVATLLGLGEMEWLDGAYWSLWVEVRFYAVAAILAYGLRRPLLPAWSIVAAFSAAVHVEALTGSGAASALSRLVFAEHQPFFTAGIALAAMRAGRHPRLAPIMLALSAVQALLYVSFGDISELTLSLATAIGLALAFALPALAMLRPAAVPFLAARPLTALGRASYGYYLLHQNAGIAILTALPVAGAAAIAAMLVVQAGLAWAAILLHRHVEAPIASSGSSR